MLLGQQVGTIVADGTSALNETSAPTFSNILTGVSDLLNNPSRVVSAGLRMRSMGAVSSDAGIV